MADTSSIEWTESTWNPVTGCDKISPGCKYCYAERMAKRLNRMGLPQYKNGFDLTLQHSMLSLPYKWTKPRTIFVNSMSDLFHNDLPIDYIKEVFQVMNNTPQHTYQILTKREKRLEKTAPFLNWTENIWMGVSIENQTFVKRINNLVTVPAAVRFLSIEPLIGEISEIDLTDIDWVIVGGESGPNARPINPDWVRFIRDECNKFNVPFFFKQWGGKNKKKTGRTLDGLIHSEMPTPKKRSENLVLPVCV